MSSLLSCHAWIKPPQEQQRLHLPCSKPMPRKRNPGEAAVDLEYPSTSEVESETWLIFQSVGLWSTIYIHIGIYGQNIYTGI